MQYVFHYIIYNNFRCSSHHSQSHSLLYWQWRQVILTVTPSDTDSDAKWTANKRTMPIGTQRLILLTDTLPSSCLLKMFLYIIIILLKTTDYGIVSGKINYLGRNNKLLKSPTLTTWQLAFYGHMSCLLIYLRDRSLQQAPCDYCQQTIKTTITTTNDKIRFSQHQACYFTFKTCILIYIEQNVFLHNVCY